MSRLDLTFKQWLIGEAKKKPVEPSWVDADYSSGYGQLRDMQNYLRVKNLGLQLFVPKRRDPAEEDLLKRQRRFYQASREVEAELKSQKLKEEKPPVLSSFRESPVTGDNKPAEAFWTSTAIKRADGKYTSDWYEFVKSNFKTWQTGYGYLFEVKSSAMILSTDYLEQYYEWADSRGRTKELLDYYKNERGEFRMRNNFPWDQLARHFDGVHHAGSRSDGFTYGWDVESTAWFNTSVLVYKGAVRLHGDYHEGNK